MKIAKVEDHYTIDEINELLKQYKNNAEVHNRLIFIKALLKGHTITEVTSILDVSRQTGSRWLKNYNKYGLDGLVSNRQNSGTKCKLSNEQLRILNEEISNPNKSYTIKQAHKFILDEFGI
uniref:helix-turn-helix domain-containing protein n=1 Tax=uncultured Methanobrevibacter sp. TaxID=253161 RepID=UPI0025D61A13